MMLPVDQIRAVIDATSSGLFLVTRSRRSDR